VKRFADYSMHSMLIRALSILVVLGHLSSWGESLLSRHGKPATVARRSSGEVTMKRYIDQKRKPYRLGAVAVFINEHGNVLLCKRRNNTEWRFPQGGLERGENFEQALYREMMEELGNNEFEILFESEMLISYDFLPSMRQRRRKRYRGQRQKWFLCCYKHGMGPDLENALDKEFEEYSWVRPKEAIAATAFFKQTTYESGLAQLGFMIEDDE
jgi:putative (di)nucleoside polyphosphate hydrolase